MKTFVLFLSTLLLLNHSVCSLPISNYPSFQTEQGLAFAISGSGGRLAQQVALSQLLINGTYANGTVRIPSYLAGVSSGALVAVGISGLLEYQASSGSAGWGFNEFNDFIFRLSNDAVYRAGIGGIFNSIGNLNDGYILNNTPLEFTLTNALTRLGYNTLGDLFLPTFITVVNQNTGGNVRLRSDDPSVSSLSLMQVLLATTAIPIAFQPRSIPDLDSNALYIDGGSGIDYLPVIPLLNDNVTTIFAITPNNDQGESEEESDIEDQSIVRNILRSYEIQGRNLKIGALEILANSNATSFLYSATLNRTFSTLDFERELLQFNLAQQYGTINPPQRVDRNTDTEILAKRDISPNLIVEKPGIIVNAEMINSSSFVSISLFIMIISFFLNV